MGVSEFQTLSNCHGALLLGDIFGPAHTPFGNPCGPALVCLSHTIHCSWDRPQTSDPDFSTHKDSHHNYAMFVMAGGSPTRKGPHLDIVQEAWSTREHGGLLLGYFVYSCSPSF